MQSKRNRKKNKDTQLDETRIGLTKLWATAWSINIIFICDGGETNRQTDRRTRKADGWWNGCAMFSKSFRSNRSRSRSWLQLPTRSASSACLSVPLCVCLSVHPACGILNFWTWPTAVRRLWGETWDRRLGTGDWGLLNWRPENRERGFRLCGAEWKPVYQQSVPLDGSCKQSELTAWQALSHEKWMMIMTTTTTMEETSQERDVAWNYDGQCWGNCCRS